MYNIMMIPSLFKSLSQLEITLLVIFILYIILPVQTPRFLTSYVDSPLGMLTMFVITVYLFFNVNPILAIVYIFVAYELLRRNNNVARSVTMIQYTPSQAKKDVELQQMNPPTSTTLEEEVVSKMAPIGRSDKITFSPSDYKPVADNLKNASMF